MKKKIAVAGSGVGGLVVGALLARKDFDVSLWSDTDKEDLGYDWTDSLDVKLLESIIGKKIPSADFCYDDIVAFFTPSEKVKVSNENDGDRKTTKMERRIFERYLCEFAEECGVQFHWNDAVKAPLVEDGRVTGFLTQSGEVTADLVIDACGIDSPLRTNLPKVFGIESAVSFGEAFFVYRAMYERKVLGEKPKCPLEIYLLPQGEKGIAWYTTRDDEIDVLIGRFSPIKSESVQKTLEHFAATHPEFSFEVKRGSDCQYRIPVRRPLNKFVADGYAAIGDSAFMTLPMNGSGINFTMNAALFLVDAVSQAENYTTENLWSYQHNYYARFGKDLAGVEAIKNTLLGMNPAWVDFLFENRIITQKEMDNEAGMSLSLGEILGKAVRGAKNPRALLALVKGLKRNGELVNHFAALPQTYTAEAFERWSAKTEKLLIRLHDWNLGNSARLH